VIGRGPSVITVRTENFDSFVWTPVHADSKAW
jgi:hypothetical protein